jgi:hypothetical protein
MARTVEPAGTPAPAGRGGPGLRGRGEQLVDGIRSRPIAAHLALLGAVAFSAGVHAGLVAPHLDDNPLLPMSFAASAVLLSGVAVAIALEPGNVWPPRAAAVLFAGQLMAYLVFTQDLLDPIGVTTKLVEAGGIVLALSMRPAPELSEQRRALAPVYVLLVAFVVLVALQASGQHGH